MKPLSNFDILFNTKQFDEQTKRLAETMQKLIDSMIYAGSAMQNMGGPLDDLLRSIEGDVSQKAAGATLDMLQRILGTVEPVSLIGGMYYSALLQQKTEAYVQELTGTPAPKIFQLFVVLENPAALPTSSLYKSSYFVMATLGPKLQSAIKVNFDVLHVLNTLQNEFVEAARLAAFKIFGDEDVEDDD